MERRRIRSRSWGEIKSAAVMKAVIVIPARWASTRFPGKPLAMIAGVSLIQRVYERAALSRRASAVYVATDDARIASHVESFGGRVLQPAGDFQSGTDRIAAAVRSRPTRRGGPPARSLRPVEQREGRRAADRSRRDRPAHRRARRLRDGDACLPAALRRRAGCPRHRKSADRPPRLPALLLARPDRLARHRP